MTCRHYLHIIRTCFCCITFRNKLMESINFAANICCNLGVHTVNPQSQRAVFTPSLPRKAIILTVKLLRRRRAISLRPLPVEPVRPVCNVIRDKKKDGE